MEGVCTLEGVFGLYIEQSLLLAQSQEPFDVNENLAGQGVAGYKNLTPNTRGFGRVSSNFCLLK